MLSYPECPRGSSWLVEELACVSGGVRCANDLEYVPEAQFCTDGAHVSLPVRRDWSVLVPQVQAFRLRSVEGDPGTDDHEETLAAIEATARDTGLLSERFTPGSLPLKGTAVAIVSQYKELATHAKELYDQLDQIVESKSSSARARGAAMLLQGKLYYAIATRLFDATPQLFDQETKVKLRLADESGDKMLQDKADEIRLQVATAWEKKRNEELASAARIFLWSIISAREALGSATEANLPVVADAADILITIGIEMGDLSALVPPGARVSKQLLGLGDTKPPRVDWPNDTVVASTDCVALGASQCLEQCNTGDIAACDGLLQASYRHEPDVPLEKVFQIVMPACESGDSIACRIIGDFRHKGLAGLIKDQESASRLFRTACAGGELTACAYLADRIKRGDGIASNPPRALALAQFSCVGGNGAGCNALGLLLEEGAKGVTQDHELAFPAFLRGCEQLKSTNACAGVGRFYANGWTVDQDYEKAAAYYQMNCDHWRKSPSCARAESYRKKAGSEEK